MRRRDFITASRRRDGCVADLGTRAAVGDARDWLSGQYYG